MTDFDTVRERLLDDTRGTVDDCLEALDRIEADNERLHRIEEEWRLTDDLAGEVVRLANENARLRVLGEHPAWKHVQRLERIEAAAREAADLAQREAADALDREQVPFAARAARPLLDVRDALRTALEEER